MLNVPGYYIDNELRVDRKDTANGIGGGLLVYTRNDIIVKSLIVENDFIQYCKFHILDTSEKNPINVTLVYRSPNSSSENTLKLAKLMENCEKRAIFLGDFNLPKLDLSNGTSDIKGRPILQAAEDSFLQNSVDFPTHIRGGALDLFLSNISEICHGFGEPRHF